MQDVGDSIQQHAAIYELYGQHVACRDRHGAASLSTLHCLRNLAQGYCVQGNLSKAEEQLQKALKLLEDGLLQSSDAGSDVIRVGLMLELADVLVEKNW